MALYKKKEEQPQTDALLAQILEELRQMRRESRVNAALSGIIAKRGPSSGGVPARSFLELARNFEDE